MFPEVYYDLWYGDLNRYRARRKALEGRLALTDDDLTYVDIEANDAAFADLLTFQLEDIKHTILIEGNHDRFLDTRVSFLQRQHASYINRLQDTGSTPIELVEGSEEWCENTKDVITSVLENLKTIPKNPKKGRPFTRDVDEAFEEVRLKFFRTIDRCHENLTNRILDTDWLEQTVSQEEEEQEEVPADSPKKTGKPRKQFTDCVIDPKRQGEVTMLLQNLLKGKRGKDAYIIIAAAIKAGLITKPSHAALTEAFGNLGAESGYNKKMSDGFTSAELDPIIAQLQNPD